MNDTTAKLERCFSLVFPELAPESVQQASDLIVPRWDSLAHITLLSLIGEEFGILVEFNDFADAFSFAEIRNRLGAQLGEH
jgi:acyl carrier protein